MGRIGIQAGFMVIGTAVGAYFDAPALGLVFGGLAGGLAGGLLFPPDPPQGPRLADLRVQDGSFGVPIPIPYGAVRLAGNLLWHGGIQEHEHASSIGKGLGGGGQTTFSYTCSFAIGLCEGPIDAVRKLWLDGKLAYDTSADNLGLASRLVQEEDPRQILSADDRQAKIDAYTTQIGQVRSAMTIYLGTASQMPDPLMESIEGVGMVPAHRGMAYLVFHDLLLTNYGNRIPNITAEVLAVSAPAYPKVTVSTAHGLGLDQIVFDPGHRRMWTRSAAGNFFTRIDTVSNTVQVEQLIDTVPDIGYALDVSLNVGLALDPDGGLYVPIFIASGQDDVARLDPTTLTVTHIGLDSITHLAAHLGPCSTLKVSQNYVWWCTFGTSGMLTVLARPGSVNLQTGLVVEFMTVLASVTFSGGGVLPVGNMIAVDRDEIGWAIACSAVPALDADTLLVSLDHAGNHAIVDLSSDVAAASLIAYDALTHALLIGGYTDNTFTVSRLLRYDIDSGTVTNTVDGMIEINNVASWERGIVGRQLWEANAGAFQTIDVDTLSVVSTVDRSLYPSSFTAHAALYDAEMHAVWTQQGANLAKFYLDRMDTSTITLGGVVSDIADRCGLTPGTDIDTSALTHTLIGYVLARRADGRSQLEPLLHMFPVDLVESDWRLLGVVRDTASLATIAAPDLAAREPRDTLPDPLTQVQMQQRDVPLRIDLLYDEPARDYQQSIQQAKRGTSAVTTRQFQSVSTPVIFDAVQAKNTVERMLYEQWLGTTSYMFTVSRRWSVLDPTDVVTVQKDGIAYVMRLTSVQMGHNGILRCEGIRIDQTVYTPSAAPPALAAVSGQTLHPLAASRLFLLDTALLRDTDDDPGFYVAAGPDGSGSWPGALVFRSPDRIDWQDIASIARAVDYGAALTLLGEGSPYVFDTGHTVDVRLATSGTLSSASRDQILNGTNTALLGQPGRWEILQWQTATQLSAHTWRLSSLLRGRRGTEWAIPLHTSGETFIVLAAATLRRIGQSVSDLDLLRYYRAVTFGSTLLSAPVVAFANHGAGLKPYAPDRMTGTRDGSNNLTVEWIRRTRVGGAWRSLVGVSLGETTESYSVDIEATPGGAVLRAIEGLTSPTATYTASEQTADGLTPGNPVSMAIYQVSSAVGRGYAGRATL